MSSQRHRVAYTHPMWGVVWVDLPWPPGMNMIPPMTFTVMDTSGVRPDPITFGYDAAEAMEEET